MPSSRLHSMAGRSRYRFFRRFLSRLLLWISVALIAISCQGTSPQTAATRENSAPPIVAESSPPSLTPSPRRAANTDRLRQYLEDLSFERYEERDRQQARNYIEQELQANGWQVEEQFFPDGINIIASLGNSNLPEILVGAHYDTVPGTPGADDNTTGVAATLEMSHLFTSDDFKGHQLKLIFFDREEQGAIGSSAYTNNTEAMAKLKGVIILEMLGYTCHTRNCQKVPSQLEVELPSPYGDFIGAVVDTEHLPLLEAFKIQEQPLELLSLEIPFKGLLSPIVLRSDHAPFWLKGVGAVMLNDTAFLRNPNYHRRSDTPESLDIDFFQQATELTAQGITSLLQTDMSFESKKGA